MSSFTIYAYSSNVLVYNETTGAFDLSPDYDPQTDRIAVTITDDDSFFDGDLGADEVGEDTNQTAVITTPDGTVLASGPVYCEAYAQISGPSGEQIFLDRIEIGGVHYGYFSSATLTAGTSYPLVASEDVDDSYGNRATYSSFQSVPCFTAGTLIETGDGPTPVEALGPGDRVMTRDAGLQPVLWTGRRDVPAAEAAGRPDIWPVVLLPGAAGVAPGGKAPGGQALVVSPQHRILLRGWACEFLFGSAEVFCAAKHLAGTALVRRVRPQGPLSYVHFAFAENHAVKSNGVWSESLLAGDVALSALGHGAAVGLRRALGARGAAMRAARRCLTAREARVYLAETAPRRRAAA